MSTKATLRRLMVLVTAAASVTCFAQESSTSGPSSKLELRPVEYYRDVRGAIVFKTYCVLCHGSRGDGQGRAAPNYSPPPADLTRSESTDEYRELIIRKGGSALGRSQFMPPWEQELTAEQIQDVVFYLKVINVNHLLKR